MKYFNNVTESEGVFPELRIKKTNLQPQKELETVGTE